MFLHDLAQELRVRVPTLIDITETEANYLAAHRKLRAPK